MHIHIHVYTYIYIYIIENAGIENAGYMSSAFPRDAPCCLARAEGERKSNRLLFLFAPYRYVVRCAALYNA